MRKLKDVKRIPVIGERPHSIPENCLIFNAPRPLYGHMEWQGEFEHGIFYVAIDPDSHGAEGFIEGNISLDGLLIEYWTKEKAIDAAKKCLFKKYPTEVDAINDLEERELIETFYSHFDEIRN